MPEPKITPTEAARLLKKAGQWKAFGQRRDAIRRDEGLDAPSARDRALAEFMPQIIEWKKNGVQPSPHEVAVSGPGVSGTADQEPPATTTAMKSRDLVTRKPEDLGPAAHKAFMAKEATIVEQIRWVGKHLDVDYRNIDVDDIPCPEAWSMLIRYRADEDAKADFWDKVYPKLLPSRAQLDAPDPNRIDGGHIIKAIDKLKKMRERMIIAAEKKLAKAQAALKASS